MGKTYEVTRTARGKTTVVDDGPLPKMRRRLRELRASTRRGVSGWSKAYDVTYALRAQKPNVK